MFSIELGMCKWMKVVLIFLLLNATLELDPGLQLQLKLQQHSDWLDLPLL